MLEEFGDEASDIKKRGEFVAAACSSTILAVEDSQVTITNDDSEKGGQVHTWEKTSAQDTRCGGCVNRSDKETRVYQARTVPTTALPSLHRSEA